MKYICCLVLFCMLASVGLIYMSSESKPTSDLLTTVGKSVDSIESVKARHIEGDWSTYECSIGTIEVYKQHLPSFGVSRIRFEIWINRRNSKTWEHLMSTTLLGLYEAIVSIDDTRSKVLIAGAGNNSLNGVEVVQLDLRALIP